MAHGSKASQSKGQNCKNNPFQKEAGKLKRLHQFAENVRRNEPVAKKSGRTIATKTRLYGPWC